VLHLVLQSYIVATGSGARSDRHGRSPDAVFDRLHELPCNFFHHQFSNSLINNRLRRPFGKMPFTEYRLVGGCKALS
jgi:hypothetical protein